MTTAAALPISFSFTARRSAVEFDAAEVIARADGWFFPLVLSAQWQTCACVADEVFLDHAEHLGAIRRREPGPLNVFETAVEATLAHLIDDAAPKIAAAEGFDPQQLAELQRAAHSGFVMRLGTLMIHASEGGHA